MILRLNRYYSDEEHTKGILLQDGKIICHTIEDPYHEKKVPGETRIPEGDYYLGLREVGGFHQRYSAKFNFHMGMIEVLSVPNFKYILLHIGNYPRDTEGCILVGGASSTHAKIMSSTHAYKLIYPSIANAIKQGDHVKLQVRRNDS